jgi:poly(hydroxyalkanoate) granule-associated protein
LKGLAIFRVAGPAIHEIRLFAEMAQLFSTAASAAAARSADRPHAEAQTSASSEAATVREVWLAGLGAIATAEEYGSRVLTTLIERGKAWEPVARTSTARAAESVGSAASAATAVVRGLGEKIKRIREPEDTASVPSARPGAERSPTREEFEALKRQVEALVARLAPAESHPSAPTQATQSE